MALTNTRLLTGCAYLTFVVVAAALVIGNTPYGTAMSMDSLYYLSAAQQINQGHGIALPEYAIGGRDTTPMTVWPPLYSIFLQLLVPADAVFGVGAGHFVVGFNIVALAAALSLFWTLACRLSGKMSAFVATLLLAIMPSMQIIYMYTWSETLFIPVVLAAVGSFGFFLVPEACHRHRWLALSVAFLALGFYLRYAVLGLVAGMCASILLLDRSSLRQRFQSIAYSAALFAALVAPLLIRNFWLANNLIGTRGASNILLSADIRRLGAFLAAEVYYGFWPIPVLFGGLFVCLTVVAPQKRQHASNAVSDGFTMTLLYVIWATAYLIFLLISRQLSTIDLDTRMIAPIVPLLVLAAVGLLHGSRQIIGPRLAWGLSGLLLLSTAANGYQVHYQIMASWQTSRTPGTLLGITYNSITNPSFASYYRLRELLKLPKNALIITDLDRPVVLHYFFPQALVKQLPLDITEVKLRALNEMLGREGIVVITKDKTASTFMAATNGAAKFQQILDANGHPMSDLLLLHLPISFHPDNGGSID